MIGNCFFKLTIKIGALQPAIPAQVAATTVRLLNEEIPRPVLGAVAPVDIQLGRGEDRRQEIERFQEEEKAKSDPPPLDRSLWERVRN